MERAMEQLNRLTRSLRRARTVELPDGELSGGRAAGGGGRERGRPGRGRSADPGEILGKLAESWPHGPGYFPEPERPGWDPRAARAGGVCGERRAVRVLRVEEAEETGASPGGWRGPGSQKRDSGGSSHWPWDCLLQAAEGGSAVSAFGKRGALLYFDNR